MPSILFVHENFPAQFGGIAGYLAAQGWKVVFATAAEHLPGDGPDYDLIKGVCVVRYRRARAPSSDIHPYLIGTEQAVLNGQAFSRLGAGLAKGGFVPDVVVAHSGWGSGSLVKVVWPEACYIQYLEWWYHAEAPEAEPGARPSNPHDHAAKTLCRNLPFLIDVQSSDAILVPTKFQAAMVPNFLQSRVTVLHDGVDDAFFRPKQTGDHPFTHIGLPDDAPIVTYATRGMEPLRGFPQFMKAWCRVQEVVPEAHCVIAGTDRICYGARHGGSYSYKQELLKALYFDETRLHFVGQLPKPKYRTLLQRSAAHVYLTRPFVLSWSLIEAMMTGAPLIVSDTEPVREAVPTKGAYFVDMDRPGRIATAITAMLDDPGAAAAITRHSRRHALEHYSASVLWPKLQAFFVENIGSKRSAKVG